MTRLFELMHWIWLEAQLSPSPLLQDVMIPYLHGAKDTARLLLKPYLAIHQWRGQGEGGPMIVNYAGLGYAAPLLKSILFVGEPTVTQVGKVPIWRSGELANSSDSDIMFVEATKYLVQNLPGKNAMTLPFNIGLTLDVSGDWEDLNRRFHASIYKQDLRRVRKYGYNYHVSHYDRDFEEFYHTMYLPSLKTRHPEEALPMPLQRAYQCFRHGVLFLIERDGQRVAGQLCSICRDVVAMHLIGVINGDERLMKEGAQGAANFAPIHWANQAEYKYVDFGSCWPYVRGVFAYKRKWGVVVNVSPESVNKRIWVKIQRDTPAVRQFLKNRPCVVIDKDGALRMLIVVDDPDTVDTEAEVYWQKQYATPGLSGLLFRSVEDLLSD